MAANELEEILTWFIGYPRQDDVTGNFDDTIKKLESIIESEKVKARIDECEKIIELLSPGYDYEFWFKIIPDRIKELESKEEAK